MKDFYYILGTDSNCTQTEIDAAYHKLAGKLQPADGEDDYFLKSHFREISEAYEILSNPVRRRVYDASYKKHHKKQLANFRVKHVNILAAGAFILFTGLFGFYVIRLISATKAVKPETVVAAAEPVVQPHKARHHKRKKHINLYTSAIPVKPKAVIKDTVKVTAIKPVVEQPVAVVSQQQVRPVVMQPVAAIKGYKQLDSSYVTYLKPNLAGTIYMHQLADYMSAVVTVLPGQSQVRVLEKGRIFYKVAFNNQVGYLPKWTIARP